MKIRKLRLFAALIAAAFVSSGPAAEKSSNKNPSKAAQQKAGTDDKSLPTPEEVAKMPGVVPEKAAELIKEVKVPAEFDATIFATPPAVNYPVFIAAAPDGTLYVSSDGNGSLGREPNRGRILRVRDTNGDGKADEVRVFVKNVDSPRGLVWDHDRVICLHPPDISAFIDRNGDGIADEEKILIKGIAFGFKDRPADHTSNGIELGVDGWIYCAIGDFGFMEAVGTDGRRLQLRGGGVVRFRPDGTGLQLFARGTRNILEVAVSPLLDIMTRDNTNDGGGWDVRFHHFTGFEDHGYPRLYKNFANELIAPLADYGGGSGCGATWLDEPGIPAKWNNAPLTADWGRGWLYHHRPTPKGATFAVDQTEFIGLTRPTDADVDASGRIYVSSWKGATFNWAGNDVGYLVRVTPKNFKPEPLPDFAKASESELVKLLESPSHRRRLEAQRTLIRRGAQAPSPALADASSASSGARAKEPTTRASSAAPGAGALPKATVALLEALAADKSKLLASRVAAIFALKQSLGEKSHPALVKLAADPTVAAWAIRALTDREDQLNGIPADLLVSALKSADDRTRREAVVALARWHGLTGIWANNETPKPETIRTEKLAEHSTALAKLLGDREPVIVHTAMQVLRQLKASDTAFALVDTHGATPQEREYALLVLSFIRDAKVVDGLIERLGRESELARRKGLLTALSRQYFVDGEWKGDSWGTRPDTRGPFYQPEKWAETEKISAALKTAFDHAKGEELTFLASELNRHRVDLGDTLGKLIAAAKADPAALPALVGQLSRGDSVPAEAIPLLVKATGLPDLGPQQIGQAIIALAKVQSDDGTRAALGALTRLQSAQGFLKDFDGARDAFFNSPKLDANHAALEAEAAKLNGKPSLFADAALISLLDRKGGSPESLASARKAMDDGWANPKRRLQLIEATKLTKKRVLAEKILAAVDDSDKAVASAARGAVDALKLQASKKDAKDTTPLVGTLKVDDAIAAVLATHGDRARGEALFQQVGCVLCHTTSANEPPRGPILSQVATIFKRRDFAEAILLPSKTLAQGFVSERFAMKDETEYDGFVTQEAADKVTIRNAAGQEVTLVVKEILKRQKLDRSIMPEGLVAALTVKDFAALIDYLESLAKK
ncbi:MAG: heme-binding protein [Verrucomicrobia bacterium]|nr:heme-binding protein [Verrucomicrobiota bacterium]